MGLVSSLLGGLPQLPRTVTDADGIPHFMADPEDLEQWGPFVPCWWCNDPPELAEHPGKESLEGNELCTCCFGARMCTEDGDPKPNISGGRYLDAEGVVH